MSVKQAEGGRLEFEFHRLVSSETVGSSRSPMAYFRGVRPSRLSKSLTAEEIAEMLIDSDAGGDSDSNIDGFSDGYQDTDCSSGESDSDAEDQAPDQDGDKKETCRARKKRALWLSKTFHPAIEPFTYTEVPNFADANLLSPVEYFQRYMGDAIFDTMAEMTNRYYESYNGSKHLNTTFLEMRKLVALHLVLGVMKYPRATMMWQRATMMPIMSDISMQKNRFFELRNNLHLVDKTNHHDNDDALWMVRPIIEAFEARCEILKLEEELCIDESMIPFKGQFKHKVYAPNKPIKRGIKIFCLAGPSGIIYRLLVYQGEKTIQGDRSNYTHLGRTNAIVMHLTERIPQHLGFKVYYDNFSTDTEGGWAR